MEKELTAERMPTSSMQVGINPERDCKIIQTVSAEPVQSSRCIGGNEAREHSLSGKDGTGWENETHLRKLYCSFIHDMGIKLKVPQMTVATAVILCHKFYICQSYAKNDWKVISMACMFLAAKIEETPRCLKRVIMITNKMGDGTSQTFEDEESYEKQKEMLLAAEKLLLATIAFDFNIPNPYKSLVAAIKKLRISSDVALVAWKLVNDWLHTDLCVHYQPHYLAAGALFYAAKYHNVKLPSVKGIVWWEELDVSPKILKEVIERMHEIMEARFSALISQRNEKSAAEVLAKRSVSRNPDVGILGDTFPIGDNQELGHKPTLAYCKVGSQISVDNKSDPVEHQPNKVGCIGGDTDVIQVQSINVAGDRAVCQKSVDVSVCPAGGEGIKDQTSGSGNTDDVNEKKKPVGRNKGVEGCDHLSFCRSQSDQKGFNGLGVQKIIVRVRKRESEAVNNFTTMDGQMADVCGQMNLDIGIDMGKCVQKRRKCNGT